MISPMISQWFFPYFSQWFSTSAQKGSAPGPWVGQRSPPLAPDRADRGMGNPPAVHGLSMVYPVIYRTSSIFLVVWEVNHAISCLIMNLLGESWLIMNLLATIWFLNGWDQEGLPTGAGFRNHPQYASSPNGRFVGFIMIYHIISTANFR